MQNNGGDYKKKAYMFKPNTSARTSGIQNISRCSYNYLYINILMVKNETVILH